MSAPDDTAPAPPNAPPPGAPTPRARGKLHLSLLVELLIGLVVLVLVGGVIRLGPLTTPGRAAIMAYVDGLSLGPFGRLHASGLHGDIWSDFKIDRLSVSDTQGVWIDVGDLEVNWQASDLLIQTFYAHSISATRVRVFRRPLIGPSPTAGKGGEQPLSFRIDHLNLRLETRPAFSVRPGLADIAANLDLDRKGGIGGGIALKSLLRPGDGLEARFDVGLTRHLVVDASAREGGGGAIAGALGLPANQAFALTIKADGTKDQGHFHLRTVSGDRTPASADGHWTQGGGQGTATLLLAASSFTAPYAAMLGPQLNLDLSARGAGGRDFDIMSSAHTDNLTASASGRIDQVHMTAPKGLKVSAMVRDLTRIVKEPAMGAGAFNGTFSGGLADWRLAGALAVNKLTDQGYGLARAEGPLTLTAAKGELRLQASLAGQGGAGQGMVTALAGPRPRLGLDVSRLADGRILLKSLNVDGAGLDLTASGDRNLFGGLNLKGTVRLSNLAAAGVGAAGQIDGKFSAAQARATTPWGLTLDAQGQGFASGYAELDRLLGARPGLHLQTDLAQGVINVTDARVTGSAAALAAKGQVGKAGELKLALSWSAQGPFEAGPLEVSGKANGSGALTGTLAAPRADLLADFDRIDLPYLALKPAHVVLSFVRGPSDTDGTIAINAGGDYGPAHAKAGFHFVGDGIELKDVDAMAGGLTIKGGLSLRDAMPSLADLTINVAPGAFVSEGAASARVKIADAGGGPVASIRLSADDLALRGSGIAIQAARLAADGPLSRLPFKVTAQAAANGAPIRFSGSGTAARSGPVTSISFEGGGRVRKADFKTLTPALFTFGPQTTSQLSLSLGGGRADVSTRQDAQGVAAKGTLSGVDLAALGEDLVGKFDADFTMNGKGPSLDGTLDARLSDARSRDETANRGLDGTVKAVLSGQRLTVNATGGAKTGGRATVEAVLPADASAAPFRLAVNPNRPIQGRFDADGEIQPIWDLFFGGDRTLAGRLTAQGTLGGNFKSPILVGHAAMSGGKLEDAATGLKLRNMAANIDLTNNLVSVQNFMASDAKAGTVTGDGRLSLIKGGESTLTLNVKGFQLIDNDTAKATATGAITVTRAGDGHAKLSGELDIDHAEISAINRSPPGVVSLDVVEKNRPGVQSDTSPAAVSRAPAVALDIKLRGARGIYLKGLGLNAEMSLFADVTGDTAAPQLHGTARVLRGSYDFAGKRFDIDDTSVVYLDAALDRIRLDLSATRDDPTLTAVIRIKGTAAKPEITLTSTPVLPNDEVLSQVLFGKSAAQLSGAEAAQLASAVASLATGGGFDVIGGLRSFVKLDRLALGADTLGAPTLSGGKYISEHVYLELTGGGKDGPSAQVEVNAGRGLSFISQVGGLEGAKLAVRWRLNYGKAKPAPRPK